MAGNINILDLPPTNCAFSVVGISKYQSEALSVQVGDLLTLVRTGDSLCVMTLHHAKLGNVPGYLESLLLPAIEGTPQDKLYARVEWVGKKQGIANSFIGVRCILLGSSTLPSVLFSNRPVFCVWEANIRGVTFQDFSDRQDNLKKGFEFAQKHSIYPDLVLRRHRDNSVDHNAILIFGLVGQSWLEFGYVAASDAKEIVEFSNEGACFYARLLELGKSKLEGKSEDTYFATYEIVGYAIDNNSQVGSYERLQ